MDDALGVGRGERVGDLGGQQRRGDGGERAVLVQVAVEVGPVDQVHDQRDHVALDDQIASADDVVVPVTAEPEQDGALPQEAHHDIGVVGELLLEDLDGDLLARLPRDRGLLARGLPLAPAPDGAGGAAPERLFKQVLAAYRPHVCSLMLRWW